MWFAEFVAHQLARPTGLFGRVLARGLNRSNRELNERTLALLQLQPEDAVIEVGFGGGALLERLAESTPAGFVAGVDISPDMVAASSRRLAALIRSGRLELHCAAADRLPYPAERFTRACTVNTIYFWEEPVAPLAELHRVLRPGGRLTVCFNPPETLKKLHFTKHGFAHYDVDQVRAFLVSAGFADIELVYGSSHGEKFVCAIAVKPPVRDPGTGAAPPASRSV